MQGRVESSTLTTSRTRRFLLEPRRNWHMMASQRVSQLGLRRTAAPLMRVQPGRFTQQRLAATATSATSQLEGQNLLAKQRLQRPVSPHLSIYKPQITWYGSGLNRVTGLTLSGSLYIFGIVYLAAPTLGWHLETQSMVAAVAAWPVAVKMGVKAFYAFPFFYHSLNGLRHLAWDFGVGFKNQQVIRSGWAVVGLTLVGSLYYTFAG